MVDFVNFSQVNFKGSTNLIEQFKAKQPETNTQSAPEAKPITASGAEALSTYNKITVKPTGTKPATTENIEEKIVAQVTDIKPSEPTKLDKDFIANFKGDDVKASNGSHAYYEEKNGNISKIYQVFEGKVNEILEINNETGNKIRQEHINDNGVTTGIIEFSPETGQETKFTGFNPETQKPDFISECSDDGQFRKSVSYDENGGIKYIHLHNDGIDGGQNIHYEFQNGKLKSSISEAPDGTTLETHKYYEGKEISTIKNKQYPVINTTGLDFKKLETVPSELGKIELDPTKIDGEKKYRSNGTLESITVKDGNLERQYFMDYSGKKLKEVNETENGKDKKTITLDDTKPIVATIQEYDNEGNPTKITSFDKDGNVSCISDFTGSIIAGKNIERYLYPNGKTQNIEILDKATVKLEKSMTFDKEGNLVSIKEGFDEKGLPKDNYYHETIKFVENKTESPNNEKSVEHFISTLSNPAWSKKFYPDTNTVLIKQDNVKDGIEYEIFSNGTVRSISGWGKDAIIMNSNEKLANLFKELANPQPQYIR